MAKARMDLEQAAEYLGMTPADLLRTRHRGLPPGKAGYVEAGILYFNRADLPKPPKPTEEGDTDAVAS